MFGRKKPASPLWEMRDRLFELNPAELGITPSAELPNVWSLLMETGHKEGPVSLVVIADQTTSLYFPTGGGMIGAGGHRTVWAAAKAFLETGEAIFNTFSRPSDRSFPLLGEIKFHLLSYQGPRMAGGNEREISGGVGPLSALFWAGQAVISQIRLVSQSHERG